MSKNKKNDDDYYIGINKNHNNNKKKNTRSKTNNTTRNSNMNNGKKSSKKKKINQKNAKLFFIMIILVLLIISTIGFDIYLHLDNGDCVKLIEKYMGYINSEEYQEMYQLISEKSKNEISEEDFIARNKNIYDGIEANNIDISSVTVNNDKTSVTYTTTMNSLAGRISFINTANIVYENEEYKIDWNSKLIFPELKENYKVKVATYKSRRGSIVDRNNKALAKDDKALSVGIVPGKMSDQKEKDIYEISKLLDVEKDYINNQLSQSYVKENTFVPIKTIEKSNKELKEKLLQIKGIMITDKDIRLYPFGNATSQLLGYVQTINEEELKSKSGKGYTSTSLIGKTGLEKVFENTLHGTDGSEIYIIDEKENKVKTLAEVLPQDGKEVKITIDCELQQAIYEEYEDDKSANVVINSKTGEVLAMVSTPTFNSNDFITGISNEKWKLLNDDENNPLINRCLLRYAPGSSMKPIIGAIGLTSEKFSADEDFGKSGKEWQKDSSWKDFKVTTLSTYSGEANLENALIYSDNIYFAKAALKIGSSTLLKYTKKIGFGENYNFIQTVEKSQISNNGKIDSEGQLANTGYGQAEVLVNPIFMAAVYSAFANNGNMMKLYLEYNEKNQGQIDKENVFTEYAANTIKDDLIQIVENPKGTGHQAFIDDIKIAGKTGTAEIKKNQNDDSGTEIGWFNCFTIDDETKNNILIVSMVEDVKNRGGSHYVVPKVKKIIEFYLQNNN